MDITELGRRLAIAEGIARDAGTLARSWFDRRDQLLIESKGPQNLVSEADRAVEDLIRQRSNRRWMISETSWESMMAPSTMASEDRGSQPSLWTSQPPLFSFSSMTLIELSPMSNPTRPRLRPNSIVYPGRLRRGDPTSHTLGHANSLIDG